MKSKGICCAGNWVIDTVKIVDLYPEEEKLSIIHRESMGTGGCPYNVLVDLARMDSSLHLEAIGVIGKDDKAKKILADLNQYNIHPVCMEQTDALPTSYTDVVSVKSTGKRTFFHNKGANQLLDFHHFDFSNVKAGLLHVGYALLLDKLDAPDKKYGTVMARVLANARECGLLTSMDVVTESNRDRYKTVVTPALKYVDYLVLNEVEAESITDISLRDSKGPESMDRFQKAAEVIFKAGVNHFVIIHMPEGAYLFSRKGESLFQASHLLPEGFIKGSVGAGDAFCAGTLYGIVKGMNYNEMLRLGTATAALCLTAPNATDGVPSFQEIMTFAEKTPYRHP